MPSMPRDNNRKVALFGVSSVDGVTPTKIKVNPATGAVLVSGSSGGGTLGGLTDVTITSPQDNEILQYDSNTSQWINATNTGGSGIANIVEDTTPQLGGNLDLNGFTVGDATDSDLTKLNAITSSAAELNILDGATLTVTELNYVDGVTSAIQTQLDAKQPLDSDLTTIASLTATTDNFIVSVSSAWASRTPSQVRTTFGLVIGTNVQAWDADLDTWAGKTAPSGTVVGTSDTQTVTNKRINPRVVTLTDGANVAVNSDDVDVGILAASGDRTLDAPTGTPVDGQRLIIRHLASSAGRTLTLATGSAGAYAFGSDITALTQTASGKYDYLGFIYNSTSDRWHLIAYVKGY